MPSVKFHHIFIGLMLLCTASAVLLPASSAERVRAPFVLIFSPVAGPVHRGSAWLGDRITPPSDTTLGSTSTEVAQLQAENDLLRRELLSLSTQLEDLKRLNADREQLGDLRRFSVPARVTGYETSAGNRHHLTIVAPPDANIAEGMPVITPRGVLGKVTVSLRGGTRVRLTMDESFRVQGLFGRFTPNPAVPGGFSFQRLPGPPPLVTGTGGKLRIANLSMRDAEAAGVRVGDVVILADEIDWPPLLQGNVVGEVVSVEKSRLNPLWADIELAPPVDPRRLREVMVVNAR